MNAREISRSPRRAMAQKGAVRQSQRLPATAITSATNFAVSPPICVTGEFVVSAYAPAGTTNSAIASRIMTDPNGASMNSAQRASVGPRPTR